jgi:quercetin dioxygenase-like cupin family protein
MIKARKWKDVEPRENPHKADVRDLYKDEHAFIVHMMLESGQSLIPHVTPVDVAFYVLEGKGTVHIGKSKMEVSKGTMVESPKGIVHYWVNTGEKRLRILTIKVPNPTSKPPLIK